MTGPGQKHINKQKKLTQSYQSDSHEWHDAALGIVHKVPESHPLLRLAADLALAALLVPLGEEGGLLSKVVQQVLDDEGALGHHNRLRIAWVLNTDDGRLAQCVHLLELWRREVCRRVPMVDYQLVWELQFFKEP
jgi:hypothetical protein